MASSLSRFYNEAEIKLEPTLYSRALNYKSNIEAGSIHSGHFMVSYVHDENDDPFDASINRDINNTLRPANRDFRTVNNFRTDQNQVVVRISSEDVQMSLRQNSIDATLSVLLKHMSLAYSGKLTSPKWKHFRGIKVKLKDKIRLNNIIWREWYMQYIKKQKPVVCQFDIPIFEKIHARPEAVVLEGKYWKRRLQCLTTEYKKWRMFFRKKNQTTNFDPIFELDKSTLGQSTDNLFSDFMDILMPSISETNLEEQSIFSQFETDGFSDFLDTFPPANFVPFSREISQLGLGDIIQPQLLQLQPSFEEINMEVDALTPLPNYLDFRSNLTSNISNSNHSYTQLLNFENQKMHKTNQNYQTPHNYTPQFEGDIYGPRSSPIPLNLTQGRVEGTHMSPPLNLTRFPRKYLDQGEVNCSATRFQGLTSGRGRNNSGGLSGTQSFVQMQNMDNDDEGPRRASTGSAPLLHTYHKGPKKHVSFVLPDLQKSNNTPVFTPHVATQPNFVSRQQENAVFVARQQDGADSVARQPSCWHGNTRLPARKNSSSILEILLSNEPWRDATLPLTRLDAGPPHLKMESMMSSEQEGEEQNPFCMNLTIGNVFSKPKNELSGQLSDNNVQIGSKKMDVLDSEKDNKRYYHTTAEFQRRCNIKQGFEMLNKLVPELNKINGCKINKATTLLKTAECCRKMKGDRERLLELNRNTRLQIENIQDSIRHLQLQLPASGISPIGRLRSNQLDLQFEEYVKSRSSDNWKFWLYSLVIKTWFVSFNEVVSTASREEMYKSLLHWLRHFCSLVKLRPEVLKTMTEISRVTTILTDPSNIPKEAADAIRMAKPFDFL